MRTLCLCIVFAAFSDAAWGALIDCPAHASAAALTRLRAAMAHGRFVAYQPTALTVVNGHFTSADEQSVRADLRVLRTEFDALITYDAMHGAENVPSVAAELGFRALIIGVWDPTDPAQLNAALSAAGRFPQLVVGLSLGNETVFGHRADPGALAAIVRAVRQRVPQLALSTTEPFHIYYQPQAQPLLRELDFVLVNVHPVFQSWFATASDKTAAQFVVNVLGQLAPLTCGPLLVKETGVPTAPARLGFSEARQASFYRELRHRLPGSEVQAFAYFAAFDAPWRASDASPAPGVHPEEAHWGLYDAQRLPKTAARTLPPLPR
jgi:exo-beta-1,3-glucanase (GH17 family)